jgi:hypothetical protein
MLHIIYYVEGYAHGNYIEYRRYKRGKRIMLIIIHRIAFLPCVCVCFVRKPFVCWGNLKCLQCNRNETAAAILSILIFQTQHLLNKTLSDIISSYINKNKDNWISLRFNDLTTLFMKSSVFWDNILSTYISEEHVTLSSGLKSRTGKKPAWSILAMLAAFFMLNLAWFTFLPSSCQVIYSSECWLTSNGLIGPGSS